MTATDLDPSNNLPRLLGITELADHLGVNVRHIRRLVHERRIPFIKWGHLIRFDPDEVSAWIDANRQRPGGVRPGPTRRHSAPVPSPQRSRPSMTDAPRTNVGDKQLRFEP